MSAFHHATCWAADLSAQYVADLQAELNEREALAA